MVPYARRLGNAQARLFGVEQAKEKPPFSKTAALEGKNGIFS